MDFLAKWRDCSHDDHAHYIDDGGIGGMPREMNCSAGRIRGGAARSTAATLPRRGGGARWEGALVERRA